MHHWHGGASHRVLALHTCEIIRRASLARRGKPPCVGSTYKGDHQTYITGTAGQANVCWLYIQGRSSDVHNWHGGASQRVLALHTREIIRRTSLARRGKPTCVGSTYKGDHQTYITGTTGPANVCWLYIQGRSSDVHHWHGGASHHVLALHTWDIIKRTSLARRASHRVLALHTWDIIRRTSLARQGKPPCAGSTYVGYHQTYITGMAGPATVCWLYIRGISSDVHHWHGGASHRVLALHTWDIIKRTSLARRGEPPCVGSTYVGHHHTYITGTAGQATVCWLYIRGISSDVHHWHGGASHRVLALHTWDIITRTSLARRGEPPCGGFTYVGYHQAYITGTTGRATVWWLYIRGISSDVHHWHDGASHRVVALHTWDIIRRTSLARRGEPPCGGFTYVGYHQAYITGTAGRATVCWLYIRGISPDVHHWHGGASQRGLALHTWDIIRLHRWHGGASHRVLAPHTGDIIRCTSLARRGKPPCVGFTYVRYHQTCITGTAGQANVGWPYIHGRSSDVQP